MTRDEYFEGLKALAREKRKYHAVRTDSFGLREIRKIYKKEGIRIDPWPLPAKIKGVYMCANNDFSVAVQRTLPDEPKLFVLAHELKHHYVDQEKIANGVVHCGDYNRNELIEIGAEVFAAEFIYPEHEFAEMVKTSGVAAWSPEDVVRLKRRTPAKISYMFVQKRLERLGVVERGAFAAVRFKKLEEQMFGMPGWKTRMMRRKSMGY
jgi:Zn-dependent peptidase ImmA (M78 family)